MENAKLDDWIDLTPSSEASSDISDTSKNKINKSNEKAVKTTSGKNYVLQYNQTRNNILSNNDDDNNIAEILKSEPMIGYKKPFFYCKAHPKVENIYYEEIKDHLKLSRVHQDPTYPFLDEIFLYQTDTRDTKF